MCKVRYAKGPLHCTNIIIPALGEEGQFARVVTMNNNFMTRSGRKVGAPKKFIYD